MRSQILHLDPGQLLMKLLTTFFILYQAQWASSFKGKSLPMMQPLGPLIKAINLVPDIPSTHSPIHFSSFLSQCFISNVPKLLFRMQLSIMCFLFLFFCQLLRSILKWQVLLVINVAKIQQINLVMYVGSLFEFSRKRYV